MELWKLNIVSLAWSYFRESKLFDLTRHVNTHRRMRLEAYRCASEGLSGANLYMAAWTSVIVDSLSEVMALQGVSPGDFDFIDIGCGKGKVLLVWRECLASMGLAHALTGIELNADLLDICRDNLRNVGGGDDVKLICADVSSFDFGAFSNSLLLFLYNPFDGRIMDAFLRRLSGRRVYVIYNNPVHISVLTDHGFRVVSERKGRYPVQTYVILARE